VLVHYCGSSVILDLMRSANATTVRWLDDSEMRAWRTYVETVGNLTTAIETDLAPTGLTLGDYQLLVYLSEAPDRRMRMCDLAVALQLSPSGLTRRLDGLVRNGFVMRIGSDDDRRVMLAVLTESGFEALEAAAPIHVESVRRRILDHLEPGQIQAMGDVFEAIRVALEYSPY
jgi:DNA-binding MarR family transcriptional regulator